MKIKQMHWVGIISSLLILTLDLIIYFVLDENQRNSSLFLFIVGLAFVALTIPFIIDLVVENRKEEKINEMFLEFSRNLAESVTTGTPVSKSIVNMRKKDYGPLSPHIAKLSNQIELGIPVSKALQTFAYEVDSPVISRAITLISEAERAGGEIDYILESSAKSIAEVEKLKKERRAAIATLVVQGYIIFFIFIGVMLIMQFKILPLVNGIGSFGFGMDFTSAVENAGSSIPSGRLTVEQIANTFLYLLLTQGLFSGLIIGKLTEGSLKKGVKHSFIMAMAAFLIATGVRAMASPAVPPTG